MKKYQVLIEGYVATGENGTAQILAKRNEYTLWEGETFQKACENALRTLKWDMSYYNKERNTYWACRFFDNEIDARNSFG